MFVFETQFLVMSVRMWRGRKSFIVSSAGGVRSTFPSFGKIRVNFPRDGGRWRWMNYSAFRLSFCISLSAFWCSGTCLERGRAGKRRQGLWYFAHTSLSLFCLKRQGWVQGHMCACHPPHFCSKCNPECQLSICLCLAGARAQHPASGHAAPAPLMALLSAAPRIPEQEAWTLSALALRTEPLSVWYAGFQDAWWVSPALLPLLFAMKEAYFLLCTENTVFPTAAVFGEGRKQRGEGGWQRCDWKVT